MGGMLGKSKFDEAPPPIDPGEWPQGVSDKRPERKKLNGGSPPEPVVIPIPQGESAFSLTERDIPDPVRLCDPWATEGVNIIAGRPKLGKTTLERQKLAAAAIGGEFLDSKFKEPVRCAFLSLEEGELLCRLKFKMAGFTEAALAGIQLFFEWPRGDTGVELLDRYLQANRDVRFVVIDSLTRFRMIPDVRMPAFMADYEAINLLHDLSKKHPGVVIDVVHHTRKAKGDDPIDDISGTYGLTAACDSAVVMRYHADGATMHVFGRLWTRFETQYSLRKGDNHTWQFLGIHLDLTDKQREALEMIQANSDHSMSGKELSDRLGITVPSAWQRLDELLEKGLVTKKYGRVFVK